jgi:hypothetical protein
LLLFAAGACAGPDPVDRSPAPTIVDTVATERLPIDGLWQSDADGAIVQLHRGRMYRQAGFAADERFGELVYADIHQSGPTTFRCREPVPDPQTTQWHPCTLAIEDDGRLVARTEGVESPTGRGFRVVALADDIWFEAQLGAWYILSSREAHGAMTEVSTVPTAEVPELPPSAPVQKPMLQAPANPYGAYHALVIGTGDYLYLPEVATAVDDADAVAALLRDRYGFHVTELRNPTLGELQTAIERSIRTVREGENLLLYFAGRGFLSEELGRCYWFPADATGDDPTEGVSNDDLVSALRALRGLRALVVADTCFTASRRREVARVEEGDSRRASKQRTRVVLTSGGLEPIQAGAGRPHSVFTGALLDVLRANRAPLAGTSLFAEIRRIAATGTSQSPEYGDIRDAGHEGGDFFFFPTRR